jgi:hypothetical protein
MMFVEVMAVAAALVIGLALGFGVVIFAIVLLVELAAPKEGKK